MLAAAKAAVVPGKVTGMTAVLASTGATNTAGAKRRTSSAVARACRCCAWWREAPSEMPVVSNRKAPSAKTRPPHRRRARERGPGDFTVLPSGPLLCGSCWSRIQASFIGKLLKHTISGYAIVALAQQGKEIRDDQQGGRGGKQQASDDGARQRRILFLAGAPDRHRDHADDHGRCRHQHRPHPGRT